MVYKVIVAFVNHKPLIIVKLHDRIKVHGAIKVGNGYNKDGKYPMLADMFSLNTGKLLKSYTDYYYRKDNIPVYKFEDILASLDDNIFTVSHYEIHKGWRDTDFYVTSKEISKKDFSWDNIDNCEDVDLRKSTSSLDIDGDEVFDIMSDYHD